MPQKTVYLSDDGHNTPKLVTSSKKFIEFLSITQGSCSSKSIRGN